MEVIWTSCSLKRVLPIELAASQTTSRRKGLPGQDRSASGSTAKLRNFVLFICNFRAVLEQQAAACDVAGWRRHQYCSVCCFMTEQRVRSYQGRHRFVAARIHGDIVQVSII